ncbi:Uncharacterized protein Fot_03842 [Forsythia ovata]|uniref:DUF6821 domain-containing protein n=1 Tax=Forsythia ovata TaxID=205694 RepID=A0ABD1XDU9_9LAMI
MKKTQTQLVDSYEYQIKLMKSRETPRTIMKRNWVRLELEHKDQLQTRGVTNVNQLHRTNFSAWFHTKFCSIGVAVATVCIVVFGTRQKSKQQQNQKLQFQIYTKDKRIKQVVHHATKLNEAISTVRGGFYFLDCRVSSTFLILFYVSS